MITLTGMRTNSTMGSMVLQVEEGTFKGYDGAELFFQTWAKKDPSAIILGVHGMGEHSDCYKRLAQGLAQSTFQLVMSDLRGHGRSSGKRGVGSIDEYVLDIKLFYEVVKTHFPQKPIFLLGHSMGGLVATKFLIRNAAELNKSLLGLVLSSPLFGIALEVPYIKRKSARLLAIMAPSLTLENEIHYDLLSHDSAVIQSYTSDSWRQDRVSPKLFLSILASIDYVFEQSGQIKLPFFMQQAGDDRIVSQPKGAEFFEKLEAKDKKIIVYKDMFHEIYNELAREKVFSDLSSWLNNHLNGALDHGVK
jgi:lysophospholipase